MNERVTKITASTGLFIGGIFGMAGLFHLLRFVALPGALMALVLSWQPLYLPFTTLEKDWIRQLPGS